MQTWQRSGRSLLLLVLALTLAACAPQASTSTTPATATVIRGDIVQSGSGSGQIQPLDTANLSFGTSGTVANNVLAFYGMSVQAASRADALPAGGQTSSNSLSFDSVQVTQASWFNDGLRQGLVLTISGYAGVDAIGAIAASYNGTFNGAIAPVPEPAPAAMLLAGLASVGMLVRRRSKNSSR